MSRPDLINQKFASGGVNPSAAANKSAWPQGTEAATANSPPGAGALFGLAIVGEKVYFADDSENSLNLFPP
jgi:hypothetical protein